VEKEEVTGFLVDKLKGGSEVFKVQNEEEPMF
jgi:hypothetical protein